MCVPYIRGLTEKFERLCRNFESVDIKVVSRTNKIMRQTLVQVTNRIIDEKRVGVVYKVPCLDCNKAYMEKLGKP